MVLSGNPGEGQIEIPDKDEQIKEHIKNHVDLGNYGMVIELAWGMLKRQGCKCLSLK